MKYPIWFPVWLCKFITDFVEGTIAVLGTINIAFFLNYVTFANGQVIFDRAGALDEAQALAAAAVLGIAGALTAAVRRNGPDALEWLVGKIAGAASWIASKIGQLA
jgi:hypothetical protein